MRFAEIFYKNFRSYICWFLIIYHVIFLLNTNYDINISFSSLSDYLWIAIPLVIFYHFYFSFYTMHFAEIFRKKNAQPKLSVEHISYSPHILCSPISFILCILSPSVDSDTLLNSIVFASDSNTITASIHLLILG